MKIIVVQTNMGYTGVYEESNKIGAWEYFEHFLRSRPYPQYYLSESQLESYKNQFFNSGIVNLFNGNRILTLTPKGKE